MYITIWWLDLKFYILGTKQYLCMLPSNARVNSTNYTGWLVTTHIWLFSCIYFRLGLSVCKYNDRFAAHVFCKSIPVSELFCILLIVTLNIEIINKWLWGVIKLCSYGWYKIVIYFLFQLSKCVFISPLCL